MFELSYKFKIRFNSIILNKIIKDNEIHKHYTFDIFIIIQAKE